MSTAHRHQQPALLILTLLGAFVITVSTEPWGSSSSFSFARELAQGTSSTIVVPSNHSIVGEFDAYKDSPLQLKRNVTVTGAQGLNTVLDLAYLRGMVQLCPTCVIEFTNITVANDRKGSSGLMDLLFGQPEGTSMVELRSAQRWRYVCTSGPATVQNVMNTPRSKRLPGAERPQVTKIGDVTWNGHVYKNALLNQDYSADIPYKREEGGRSEGGYILVTQNMRRICLYDTPEACLAIKDPTACAEEVLSAQQAGPAPLHQLNAAAVAVPVVCAALVTCAVVAFVLWRLNKRKAAAAAAAPTKQLSHDSQAPAVLVEARFSSGEDRSDVEKGLQPAQRSAPCSSKREGWVVANSITNPHSYLDGANTIHFGDLLGAGSFGSVYKGRWNNNTDVAVKVIQHDAAQADEVENEVLLMMGLQHDCIVAAYHFVTYARTAAVPESLAGALSSSSSNTPVHQRILDGSICSDQTLSCNSNREVSARKWSGLKQLAESHLVMEYCDCGTLTEAVAKLRKQQQQQQQQQQQGNKQGADQDLLAPFLPLLQDIARGLQAIHSRNVVHGDLNARNVLVRSTPSSAAGLTAKLADFGLSRAMKQHQTHRTTKTCGTMSHMPPEVLKDGRMSPAMDVYAFGVMMWEVATGATAFKRLHYGGFYQAVVVQGLRPELPPAMPPDYAALMQRCWAAAPPDRPTADQLVEAVTALIMAREGQASLISCMKDTAHL